MAKLLQVQNWKAIFINELKHAALKNDSTLPKVICRSLPNSYENYIINDFVKETSVSLQLPSKANINEQNRYCIYSICFDSSQMG